MKSFQNLLNARRKKVVVAIGAALSVSSTQVFSQELEELVVTATKRSESVQDVSAAVTAFNGDDLINSQVNTLEDLQVLLPGLTFGNDFNFAKIFIRGVGMSSSFPGIDPSVALHVDGAVISQAAAQFASLFDLQRVEVIRGPQGTLYGRNATGGSVNLITAKPTEEFEGYTRLTVGGEDLNIIAEGALSGPISDNVQGRLAVRYNKRDGYGTHTGTGEDIDDADKLGIRGQLRFMFGDTAENLLALEHYREDENSRALKFIRASFPNTQIPGLVAIGLPNVLPNSRDAGGDFVPEVTLDTNSITNTFNWAINEGMEFKSITNYREFDNELLQDFDISDTVNGTLPPSPTSTTQYQVIGNEHFSQEFQLSLTGERWRGLVGLYYFDETVDSDITIGRDPKGAPDKVRVDITGALDIKASALFANFTYDLTDALSVKLGGRYSDEERVVTNLFGVAPPPAPGAIFDPAKRDEKEYSDFTPEVGFEYRVSDDLMFYTTYTEGFKSGTANLGERSPKLIDEETINNIEVGMKGTFLDNRLQMNVAVFDYEVEDAQFDRTFPIPVPPFFAARLENAASTDGRGIEIETRWAATDRLTIDANATFYDIEFSEFESLDPLNEALFGANSTSVTRTSLVGNTPRNTPDTTFNIKGDYHVPLDSGASLTLTGNVSYKSEQFFTEFNNPILGADAYTIVDMNLLYTSPDEKFTFNVWAKNLNDEFVRAGAFAISTSRTIAGTYLPPRTFGVTAGYKF